MNLPRPMVLGCLLVLTCSDGLGGKVKTFINGALAQVSEDYQDSKRAVLQTESDLASGAQAQQGCVYVAVSKAVAYPRIGATRRSDPSQRLRELS